MHWSIVQSAIKYSHPCLYNALSFLLATASFKRTIQRSIVDKPPPITCRLLPPLQSDRFCMGWLAVCRKFPGRLIVADQLVTTTSAVVRRRFEVIGAPNAISNVEIPVTAIENIAS